MSYRTQRGKPPVTSPPKVRGYYRVPEELKSLLVDLTISLLHNSDADRQQIYSHAAAFLEARLDERNAQTKGFAGIASDQVLIKPSPDDTNNNVKVHISDFADRESKCIINYAYKDYLNTSLKPESKQNNQENRSETNFGDIETDLVGNLNMVNAYEHLEHPLTIKELEQNITNYKTNFFTTKLTDESPPKVNDNKNVYESLEQPLSLTDIQAMSGCSEKRETSNEHHAKVVESYANRQSEEIMRMVYQDLVCRIENSRE